MGNIGRTVWVVIGCILFVLFSMEAIVLRPHSAPQQTVQQLMYIKGFLLCGLCFLLALVYNKSE